MSPAVKPVRSGRLIAAGLVTGLILNVGEAALHAGYLGEATRAAYAALERTAPAGPENLALLVLMTFGQGVMIAWLYTVIRTTVSGRIVAVAGAGLTAWFLSSVYSAVYLHAGFPGIFPDQIVWTPVAWEFVEYLVATFAGALVYGDR